MLRWVLDTNVVISGLIWRGPPHEVIEAVLRDEVAAFTSYALVSELSRKLSGAKLSAELLKRGIAPEKLLGIYASLCDVVSPVPLPVRVCRDPDDDMVLACAAAARADTIVTGDDDLLSLREYEGIAILNPAQALARIVR